MKGNTLNKIVMALCLVGMVSCKAHKHLASTSNRVDSSATAVSSSTTANVSAADKMNQIRAAQLSFTTFSGKAKTKLDINGSSNDVTLNIRINKGQKIWISITALAGIEVARALITPDSIQVINRFQSLYLKKPFSYIYTYASRQVNYATLESLLIGNAIPQLLTDNSNVDPANGNIVLTGNAQDLIYKMIIRPDMKVSQTNLTNETAGQSLTVNNNNFMQAGSRVIPSDINISSTVQNKKIEADLHYTRVESDQLLDFPFNIPSRYSPAN